MLAGKEISESAGTMGKGCRILVRQTKRDLCVGKGVKPKVQERERKSEREEGPLERGLVSPLAPLYP